MKNWTNDKVISSYQCSWIEDSNDALLIAKKLDIPFQIIDLSKEYKNRIINYMFNEYQKGNTPNPDILCNREIKFNIFLKIALSFGADYIATGHYVQKKTLVNPHNGKIIYRLIAGNDRYKDQSYFLCQLNQYKLSKTLFPIGNLKKKQVRKIAKNLNFITSEKKDSQGLCFVGKISLPVFLQQKLIVKKGKIIEIFSNFSSYSKIQPKFKNLTAKLLYESINYNYNSSSGKIIGEHNGAHFFTKGQRKGLKIGGYKDPIFVLYNDIKKNNIYVGEGKNHPGLFKKTIFIPFLGSNWIRKDLALKKYQNIKVYSRIRYRQLLQSSVLYREDIGYFLRFNKKISGISEGQFAACYINNELIFSGIIN